MTLEERNYFKMKADRDKVRYLDEQKAFYDEVEKIGKNVGTVTTKEGKVVVASTVSASTSVISDSSASKKIKGTKNEGGDMGDSNLL